MANCFDNVPHESIDFCPNDNISGGVSARLFYAPASFLDKLTPPTLTGNYETRITIPATNLAFKTGKGWKGIDVMVDENELKNTFVGNRGNKKAKAEMDFYIPVFKPEAVGFLDTYKNVPMVFAIPDANGLIWILGTKLNPAFVESADGTTGKKYEDNSGTTVKVSANSKLYRFAGTVQEAKGTSAGGSSGSGKP